MHPSVYHSICSTVKALWVTGQLQFDIFPHTLNIIKAQFSTTPNWASNAMGFQYLLLPDRSTAGTDRDIFIYLLLSDEIQQNYNPLIQSFRTEPACHPLRQNRKPG